MSETGVRAGLTRRSVLRRIALGAACLPLADAWFLPGAARADDAAAGTAAPARARSVIEIWASGGPSHLETFDPKPEAGSDYCGPLASPVETNVAGLRIGELLPRLARQADKYSVIRSMSHGSNAHETATYVAQTGRDAGERLVYPSIGTVVSLLSRPDRTAPGLVPPYVVLTTPRGRFSETGFLGPRFQPFVTGGDPNQARFAVEGITADGFTDERQRARRNLLRDLDTLGAATERSPASREYESCQAGAYEFVLGDAGRIFDLSQEKVDLRDRYGRTTFGQSCLAARRLVEHGVPYVTIHSGGWDTHKQHFETMRRKLPELDAGLSTLLADLADRGLLASTVVWWSGEFGRTPRVQWEAPWNGGRGHHGACYSALVAGGGFRGGQVLGASDAKGEEPVGRAVHPRELHASIFRLMGIDPDGRIPNERGLDVSVTPPVAVPARPLEEVL